MASTHRQPQQQPGGLNGPVANTNTAAAATPYSTSEQPPRPRSKKSRRHSLPFVFPPLCQPNVSSTSILPNTAEGRPIPLDDNTAAHCTTALRELNRSQPVLRHRYAKSNGTPSTTSTTTGTYSQPVIVRTYSGPPPSSSANRRASRRVPLSTVSTTSNASNWRPGWNGMVLNMARPKERRQAGADAKLPPLEAFSFKSIMADMQQDIGADLDRIAEICARSRYSLSNQYEVHVTPHGSGSGFLRSVAGPERHNIPGGPTLQAIPSDDEHSSTRHKKRRAGARRRSVAYGTLETIMSSSRSSDEEKGKKKSAAEIAEEVRGRAARPSSNGSRESPNSTEAQASSGQQGEQRKVVRRKSPSFANAVLDSSRSQAPGEGGSPRTLGTGLVSGPAKPKTSRNHLEIRTSSDDTVAGNYTHEAPSQPSQAVVSESVASAAIAYPEEPRSVPRLLSGFSSWMPWIGGSVTEIASSDPKAGKSKSYAEGTLRELLLKGAEPALDQKGKGVERMI
ncbi:hypothetical protein DL765_010968 [Monosporascus sp. GIB2]|nr:hypothetical protein DL765_010968 [Monosporascus sp. GIB2]